MPTAPHSDGGTRREPVVSVPTPPSAMPATTAAVAPDVDPPVTRSGSCGLRQSPWWGLRPSIPYASSLVWPLPTTTAPAARRRATAGASASGCQRHAAVPAVVGIPATSITSLTHTGIPHSGPGGAARAAARAASPSTWR